MGAPETEPRLRTITAVFQDPAVEHRYRVEMLPGHRRRALLTMVAMVGVVGALLFRDLLLGSEGVRAGSMVRIIGLLVAAFVAVGVHRVKTPLGIDVAFVAGSLTICGAMTSVHLTQASLFDSHFGFDVLFLFLIATAFPSRFILQAGPLILTVILGIVTNLGSVSGPVESVSIAITLGGSGCLALLLTHFVNREQRRLLWMRESVHTLRGILPICAECKMIRDESGAWHSVESVVTRGTEATFSHGLCASCADRAMEEFVEG